MRDIHYTHPLFQRRLKEQMAIHNLTAQQLGNLICCDRKSIYAWYNGTSCPDIVFLNRLCGVFNVSADYLLGRSD